MDRFHYIIKKKYSRVDFLNYTPDEQDFLIPTIQNIEEQDAKNLGFNVIWVNSYVEISNILSMISKK